MAAPAPAMAALNTSAPMLCAITTIMECESSGECQRHAAQQHPDFPSFLRINVAQGVISDAANSGRKSPINASTRLDGRLILNGGENGRGWSATIAEDTGRLTAGVVASDFIFALFGACTSP
jgi:hypothetical protein